MFTSNENYMKKETLKINFTFQCICFKKWFIIFKGVMNLVISATGDKDVTDKINKVSVAVREEGVSTYK